MVVPPIGAAKGKMRIPGEDMHREFTRKQDRAGFHDEADNEERASRSGRDSSVRGDRERSDRVQQEKQRAPLREFAAVRVDARGRQRHTGRTHQRGHASEN